MATEQQPVQRENIVGHNTINYSKFDNLDFSSDEDDCHPNIEISTWRRLKERMRKEKGIVKREPYLKDRYNTTYTNENHVIDPSKAPKTSEEQQNDQNNNNDNNNNNNNNMEQKENDNNDNQLNKDNESKDNACTKVNKTKSTETKQKTTKNNAPQSQKKKNDKSEEDVFKARTDPQIFLDQNLEKLKKFALIKNNEKSDRYLKKYPELIHEASEGYLITFAVDRAVEGAEKKELLRLSRRCLQVHNLVQSCCQQNCSPEIGVNRFYEKLYFKKELLDSYEKELKKQINELMERIEVRRVERLKEAQYNNNNNNNNNEEEYEIDESEKAPLGPGGLDPTEVLNSLPEEMQQAFVDQNIPKLKEVLSKMSNEEASYHMQRCIDAGLWVQPSDNDNENENENENENVVEQEQHNNDNNNKAENKEKK